MKSRLFTIDSRDLINGLFVAFLAAVLSGLIEILNTGAVFTWAYIRPVLIAGLSAAISYLLNSLATNSHNQIFTKEPNKATNSNKIKS
jgi:hypothetical protein